MKRVLVISSFVAKGSVGLQATLPALRGNAIEPIAIPTVVLSNHPGFKACAGTPVAPGTLEAMVDALEANGWLAGLDAVFTGYLPSVSHVQWAKRTVERVLRANPTAIYVADPVLGDDPGGLYIGRDVADAVRSELLALAKLITPNRFELSWLADRPVTDAETAIAAARHLNVAMIAATSIPTRHSDLANLLISGDGCATQTVRCQPSAPHGTGDYFAGALTAQILIGKRGADALSAATEQTAAIIEASQNSPHLAVSTM
ncbi:MAG: PfkB family carbohydrate kinase [Hyphomicrobium sp.]